jgi:phosphate transport system protein
MPALAVYHRGSGQGRHRGVLLGKGQTTLIRFREQLDELQNRLLEMAGLVESAIHQSVTALIQRDEAAAKDVFWKEALINQAQMEIDEYATRLLALYQPMAGDMRYLTAVIKINGDLERMGDLAVNITHRALALMRHPPVSPLIDIPRMANLVENMVRKSLDALTHRDDELARTVLLSDDEVDFLKELVSRELMAFMQQESSTVPSAVDLIFIAHNLERIADHATNIAEDVLFLSKGIDVRHHAELRKSNTTDVQ